MAKSDKKIKDLQYELDKTPYGYCISLKMLNFYELDAITEGKHSIIDELLADELANGLHALSIDIL